MKIEFVKAIVQMLNPDVMIHLVNTAFQVAEVALNGIGADHAAVLNPATALRVIRWRGRRLSLFWAVSPVVV